MTITYTPGWTDITSYVRNGSKPIDITRGKKHELARIETSTMKLTVQSDDDRFNPMNASGPYYPYVQPTVPIRVTADYEEATEHLWRGYVKGWPQRWTGPAAKSTQVPLSCIDVFGLFSRIQLRDFGTEMVRNRPVGYWRCNWGYEDQADKYQDSSGNGHTLVWDTTGGSPASPQNMVPLLFNGSNIQFSSDAQFAGVVDDAAFRIVGNRSVAAWMWINPDNDGDGFATLIDSGKYLTSSTPLFTLGIAMSGGAITVQFGFNGQTTGTLISSVVPFLGATNPSTTVDQHWVHAVATWHEADKKAKLYINGQLVSDIHVPTVADAVATVQEFEIGRKIFSDSDHYGGQTSYNAASEIGVFDSELQAGAVSALYDNRLAPYSQGSAGIPWRLFPLVGWDRDDGFIQNVDDATPYGSAGMFDGLDSTLFSELRKIGRMFNAEYYVDTEGRVVHYPMSNRTKDFRTPIAAFGDTTGLGYTDLVMPLDNTLVRNIWEVESEGAGTQRVLDQDSIDLHGPKTEKISGVSYDQPNHIVPPGETALSRALIGLAATKDAHVRVDKMVVVPGNDSGIWDAIFASDLLRRVTVTRTPPGGTSETDTLVIQKIKTKIILDRRWRVEYQLSPTANDDYWLLDDDTLDETTKLGW